MIIRLSVLDLMDKFRHKTCQFVIILQYISKSCWKIKEQEQQSPHQKEHDNGAIMKNVFRKNVHRDGEEASSQISKS